MGTDAESPVTWGWDETGPVWSARAFVARSGLDHLGLARVSSDRILPSLAPGINVLTVHPRYWSFYSWVLDDFWSAKLPRTRASFQRFYRPREALFAMACHLCDAPEHATLLTNIVGTDGVSSLIGGATFDPQINYIKQALGGYSLYYRTAMESTGVLVIATPANGFPVDAPTPTGRALGERFRSAVQHTELARTMEAGELSRPVSQDVIREFARVACLCQLRVAKNADLPLLQDLFLHHGDPREVGSRRETLRMILDVSQCRPAEGLGQDDFREVIYFRALDDTEYAPRADLLGVARRWRVYQGREYFSFVFNRLLRWVSLNGLDETDGGVTLMASSRLWELVGESLDEASAHPKSALKLPPYAAGTPVSQFLEALRGRVAVDCDADATWPRNPALDEHALHRAAGPSAPDDGHTLAALLALLLLLRERFGLPARLDEFRDEEGLLAEGGSVRNGMTRFMHRLNQMMLREPSLAQLARFVIEDFVVVQHERVALAKLPEDTFRLRRVGDHLQFFPQEAPAAFGDSRFRALRTMVHELGWVSSLQDPHRALTESGARFLREGDLPAGALADAAARFAETEASDS